VINGFTQSDRDLEPAYIFERVARLLVIFVLMMDGEMFSGMLF